MCFVAAVTLPEILSNANATSTSAPPQQLCAGKHTTHQDDTLRGGICRAEVRWLSWGRRKGLQHTTDGGSRRQHTWQHSLATQVHECVCSRGRPPRKLKLEGEAPAYQT